MTGPDKDLGDDDPSQVVKGQKEQPGGVYAAFAALGHIPTTMTEEVSARMPTPGEADTLGLGPGMPVLTAQRVTRDKRNRSIELVRVVATEDRTVFVYDDLLITQQPPG